MSSSWEVKWSKSKNAPYFFNRETRESVWDPPAGLAQEDVAKLPGAEYLSTSGAPDKVRASHLLVKHSGSRRPASWKEAKITRSKDEAIAILRTYAAEINGDKDKFAELAQLHSDCSSHEHGGDLGPFGRGQMQKPFEDATFALPVGKISDIVSTDSGVHLIMRTA